MLGHADDLGGGARLAPLVRRRERLDDLGRAAQDHGQGRIGGKGVGNALQNHVGRMVAPHGVDGDGYLVVWHSETSLSRTFGERP